MVLAEAKKNEFEDIGDEGQPAGNTIIHRIIIDRRMWVLPILFWAGVVGLSFWWNLTQLDRHAYHMAINRGRLVFETIQTVRLWNARHGGVYVPVTETTPSNIYLKTLERDITTPAGIALTMINPAYMTRQIGELLKEGKTWIRITSLKPINPINTPDDWEASSLESFETGAKERLGHYVEDGTETYRYMAPLVTERACLACHYIQGYREGDIRGGIRVSFPKASISKLVAPRVDLIALIHGMAWLVLSGLTLAMMAGLRASFRALERAYSRQDLLVERRTSQLAASNKHLEEFAYITSHDLQEPLRTVSSYLGLFSKRYEDSLNEDGRELLSFAIDASKHLKLQIRDLLEYSRVAHTKRKMGVVEMRTIVDEVLSNLETRITKCGARVEVSPELPAVLGDRFQLIRLVQNLVSNALKYRSPDRPPRVRIGVRLDGRFWEVSVADNGIGIEEEYRERIFAIFQRLHAQGTYEGSGIGLAICQRVVECHGGTIRVESAEGGGSIFTFTVRAMEGQSPEGTSGADQPH